MPGNFSKHRQGIQWHSPLHSCTWCDHLHLCKMAPACPDEDNSVLQSCCISVNVKRRCKKPGSAKPGRGTLIQRGVTVSPSMELNEQLFSSHAGVSSTCPQPPILLLPCLHTIPFLPGSCTRSWTGEYYKVHSTTLPAATAECLAPGRKQCHYARQAMAYESYSKRV